MSRASIYRYWNSSKKEKKKKKTEVRLKGTDSFEVKNTILMYKHNHAKTATLYNVLGIVLETHFFKCLEFEKDLISFDLP